MVEPTTKKVSKGSKSKEKKRKGLFKFEYGEAAGTCCEIGGVFLKLPLTEQKPSNIASPQAAGNHYLKPTGSSKACGEIFNRTTALGPSEYTYIFKTTTKVTATATVGID